MIKYTLLVINMRMHLRNKKLKLNKGKYLKKIKFNSKNLFIFLLSLSVVAIIFGVIFFFILSSSDKVSSSSSITDYFTIKDNYNYISLLKNSILENTFNIFLIWILGLSVIGVIVTIVIYFFHMFSIGFSIASIFSKYGAKGILGSICYLVPSKVCYIIVLFLLTFFAIKISYKLIVLCFGKEEIDMKKEMRKYFKIIIFAFISILFISILEVFIDPFFIKLFTKL